jgi:hypothetical protein
LARAVKMREQRMLKVERLAVERICRKLWLACPQKRCFG